MIHKQRHYSRYIYDRLWEETSSGSQQQDLDPTIHYITSKIVPQALVLYWPAINKVKYCQLYTLLDLCYSISRIVTIACFCLSFCSPFFYLIYLVLVFFTINHNFLLFVSHYRFLHTVPNSENRTRKTEHHVSTLRLGITMAPIFGLFLNSPDHQNKKNMLVNLEVFINAIVPKPLFNKDVSSSSL